MGVMKVTDSDGNVGYLETSVDLTSTSPTAPARIVQNREIVSNGAIVSAGNPLQIAITNWSSGQPVTGPGTSTAHSLPQLSDTSGHVLTGTSVLVDATTGLLGDVGFVGTLQSTPSAVATLTANQNDYNPGSALILSVNPSTSSITITGFTGGQDGRFLMVRNVGTGGFTITLANLTTSLAANQINSPSGSLALAQGSAAILVYDASVTNWRVLTFNAAVTDATFSRNMTFSRYFCLSGNVAGSALSASQNNYAQSNNPVWQFSASTTGVALTGMANTNAGSVRILENTGATNPITISNANASSSAANRFTNTDAADTILPPLTSLAYWYDTTNSVWRPVGPGRFHVGNYAVASLPALGTAGKGFTAYATNGRKGGEGAGSGTGVPVYFDGTAWRTYPADAAVTS